MKSILVLLLFITLFAFVRQVPTLTEVRPENLAFQKTEYYQSVSLNYTNFIASMLWIRSMVGYGESLRTRTRNPNIMENGQVLAEIDPRFKKIYEWFPAIPLNNPEGPSVEEFKKLDALMEHAIAFNDDPELNYSAAMNHIGFNKNLTRDEKLHFYKVAAGFLKPILSHPKAPPLTAGIYSYFKKGGHFKNNLDPEEEVEFITTLLFSSSANEIDRKALEERLVDLGYSDASLNRKLQYEKIFQEKKRACCAYFNDDLLLAYGFDED